MIKLKYKIEKYHSKTLNIVDHIAELGVFKIVVRKETTKEDGTWITGWLTNDCSPVTPERGGQEHSSIPSAKRYYERKLAQEIKKYAPIKPYL